jgi:hypothetical protein
MLTVMRKFLCGYQTETHTFLKLLLAGFARVKSAVTVFRDAILVC